MLVQPPLAWKAVVVALTAHVAAIPHSRETNAGIAWAPCEASLLEIATAELLCANITVPLDYSDPQSNTTHTLELVKAPALTQHSRGSILLNYGGPGADGRKNIATTAPLLYK